MVQYHKFPGMCLSMTTYTEDLAKACDSGDKENDY